MKRRNFLCGALLSPLALFGMAVASQAGVRVLMSCGHLGNGLYCSTAGCANRMAKPDETNVVVQGGCPLCGGWSDQGKACSKCSTGW